MHIPKAVAPNPINVDMFVYIVFIQEEYLSIEINPKIPIPPASSSIHPAIMQVLYCFISLPPVVV